MPRIDGRTGDVVIRIVYDGIPEAGKTTNIHRLFGAIPLQRRGALGSPASEGRRTEFFDWLDFAGGFVEGRRVRCQLVSVPGQPQLLHRRTYLLETADVVVFVADAQEEHVDANRACLAELARQLDALRSPVPVAIVVQANKQDLAGALRPRSLASVLELPVVTPVVPAVAHEGRGVMDTFVLAARLATDRVRAIVLAGTAIDPLGPSESNADALHAAMLDLETTRTPDERTSAHVDTLFRSRANDVDAAKACEVPRAESLLAGHVWPPVKGRAAVAAAGTGSLVIPDRVVDWAPDEAIEIGFDSGWLLHSSRRWSFPDEAAARAQLMALVRGLLGAPDLVPEGRALFLGKDGDGFRVWMLTPEMASIASELVTGQRGGALEAARVAAGELRVQLGSAIVRGGASGVAVRNGRTSLLGGVDPGGQDIEDHARSLARRGGGHA